MKNFKRCICVIICFILLAGHQSVHAYSAENTHPVINRKAANASILDGVLINQLGHSEGIKTTFKGKSVEKWIENGGEQEDKPFTRCLNHFHDPLIHDIDNDTWGTAGLGPGYSALVWSHVNNYSWWKAREAYYGFLTVYEPRDTSVSVTNPDTGYWTWDHNNREFYSQKTFRSLGQVMHLVSDMAVPAHVRMDSHIAPLSWLLKSQKADGYEKWVATKEKIISGYSNEKVTDPIFENFDENPPYDEEILSPISALFDQNSYQKDDDDPEATWASFLGLAEFTNANFYSQDTLDRTDDYPFPDADQDDSKAATINYSQPTQVELENGKTVLAFYYYSKNHNYRLAQASYLDFALKSQGTVNNAPIASFVMDDQVYGDYSTILIPRAIGYSEAVLNYFFRGAISLEPDTENGYGFKIANWSDEDLEGTFELYYDDTDEKRHPVPIEETPWIWEQEFTINAHSTSDHIDVFMPPEDMETPGRYMLVFRGKAGHESPENDPNSIGAVIGRAIDINYDLDISLPASGVYAFTDKDLGFEDSNPRYIGNPASEGFDKIALTVKNNTSDDMSSGTIKLIIRYKICSGEPFKAKPDNSALDAQFTYIEKEHPTVTAIPADSEVELEFELGDTQIPIWATDVYLIVSFEGNHGSTANSVCMGIRDISEPSPYGFANTMDKVCIENELLKAGSQEALEAADINHDGVLDNNDLDVYPHYIHNLKVWFSDSTQNYGYPYYLYKEKIETNDSEIKNVYLYREGTIDPGETFRFFVLQDLEEPTYMFSQAEGAPVDPNNSFCQEYHVEKEIFFEMIPEPTIGARNQINNHYSDQAPYCSPDNPICYQTQYTDLESYNGLYLYVITIMYNKFGVYPEGSTCSYKDED